MYVYIREGMRVCVCCAGLRTNGKFSFYYVGSEDQIPSIMWAQGAELRLPGLAGNTLHAESSPNCTLEETDSVIQISMITK